MGNKLLKTLLGISAISLCTMYTASAEHIEGVNFNYATRTVEISGKFFEDYEGDWATVFVLKPGFRGAVADINNFDVDDIEKQKQIKIEDGKFSLEFELNTPKTGKYATYIKAGSKDVKYTFVQTSATEAGTYYGNIMDAESDTAFYTELSKKAFLNLADTVYNAVDDKEAVCTMVYNDKSGVTDIDSLRDKIIAAANVQALNEGKAELVFDELRFIDEVRLGLDKLKEDKGVNAYEIYLGIKDAEGKVVNAISEDGKKELIKQLQGNDYESIDAFLNDFVGKATIAAIRYNENTDQTKSILEGNNKVNGFDLAVYKNDTKGEIEGKLISSTTWKISEIKKIVEDTDEDTDTGNGGSSSGGSSSSGSSSRPSVGGSSGGYSQDYTIGGLSKPTTPETVTFTDLDSVEWARPAIERLAKKGIVSGRGDGIFAPNDNVTRAEFLTMILNTLGLNQPGASCSFSDVTTGDWYYQPVAAGTAMGIAAGYDNGAFGAKDNIIRQDAAVMLNNAITKVGRSLTAKQDSIEFSDAELISDYAKDAVDTLTKAGIINGADGKFMPKETTTRAQAAVMLSGLMDALGMEG